MAGRRSSECSFPNPAWALACACVHGLAQVQDAWLRAQQQAEELTQALRSERRERAEVEEQARGLQEGEYGPGKRGGGKREI